MLVLSLPYARSTNALSAPACLRADVGVRLIKKMAMLTVSLRGVAFELDGRGSMKVLSVGLRNQMARVTARRVSADVTRLHALRNGLPCHRQHQPVSKPRASAPCVSSGCSEMAVARGQSVPNPFPTFIGAADIHLRPHPFLQRPIHHFRALVDERVAMTLPATVVHRAPRSLFRRLQTVGD